MDDWNNLRVLMAIIETGSVGAAAERLGVSAATVSRRLTATEEALGLVLVERRPRGLVATPAARAMVAPLREAEAALARAVQVSQAHEGTVAGPVRVAALPSLAADVICPALPRFAEQYPEVRIELMLDYRVVNLGRGDADIAVRSARPTQENLVARRITTLSSHPHAARTLLDRLGSDLADLPWIAWPERLGVGEERWFREHAPGAKVALVADDIHAQARACEAGLGVAILADAMGRRYRDVVPVPGAPEGYAQELWLAATEASRMLPRVDAVWRFLESLVTAT
ncbi:MAG: LysR family transcriptional regulator [Myxococcota bacterium]